MGYTSVFVSGSWDDMAKVNEIIQRFEEISDVTHKWTAHESGGLLTNKIYLRCQTLLCIDGIDRAECLVAIMDDPTRSYLSTWTEIGMAIVSNIPVLIFGPLNTDDNIYTNHPSIRYFATLNEIAEFIKERI